MEPLLRLQVAVDQARPIIAAVPQEKYDLPTPCSEWSVRQLINHMIGGLTIFRDVAVDGSADPALFGRDLVGADAAESFDEVADAAIKGWTVEGRADGVANLPFGTFPAAFALQLPATDMLVHGWDLAKATGQQVAWNASLVDDTLRFCEQAFTEPEMRGHSFDPPVDVPDDAPTIDRLVALLGRRP